MMCIFMNVDQLLNLDDLLVVEKLPHALIDLIKSRVSARF